LGAIHSLLIIARWLDLRDAVPVRCYVLNRISPHRLAASAFA
jgi:hypothetical protein